MSATLHETPAESSAKPEIVYAPLTLEGWATHYGVGTKELAWAMRAAMTRIFGEDKEIMRNEGNPSAIREVKAGLKRLHRTEDKKDGTIMLSQPFQRRVRTLLEREIPTPPSEYFTVKQLKLKFPKVNFNELTKIFADIRREHPEWFCRTKNSNGGRPSYSPLRRYEREFTEMAKRLVDDRVDRRTHGYRYTTPPASHETKRLMWWGETGVEDIIEGRYA